MKKWIWCLDLSDDVLGKVDDLIFRINREIYERLLFHRDMLTKGWDDLTGFLSGFMEETKKLLNDNLVVGRRGKYLWSKFERKWENKLEKFEKVMREKFMQIAKEDNSSQSNLQYKIYSLNQLLSDYLLIFKSNLIAAKEDRPPFFNVGNTADDLLNTLLDSINRVVSMDFVNQPENGLVFFKNMPLYDNLFFIEEIDFKEDVWLDTDLTNYVHKIFQEINFNEFNYKYYCLDEIVFHVLRTLLAIKKLIIKNQKVIEAYDFIKWFNSHLEDYFKYAHRWRYDENIGWPVIEKILKIIEYLLKEPREKFNIRINNDNIVDGKIIFKQKIKKSLNVSTRGNFILFSIGPDPTENLDNIKDIEGEKIVLIQNGLLFNCFISVYHNEAARNLLVAMPVRRNVNRDIDPNPSPSRGIRRFINFAANKFGKPVYLISDFTPDGIELLLDLAQGEADYFSNKENRLFDYSKDLVIPSLKWIGFKSEHVECLKKYGLEKAIVKINAEEVYKLKKLKKDPRCERQRILNEIEYLIRNKKGIIISKAIIKKNIKGTPECDEGKLHSVLQILNL